MDIKIRAEVFKRHRQRLFGLAYRMLGTSADAEDIVQETYLRWHKTDLEKIESQEAWLVSVATRLSIDRLRLLTKERETYIGPWLPEPFITETVSTPEEELEFADNLSLAFLALLEKLSASERAAFLLREVFDVSYAEIARIVGKNETACRQLIHRARQRVRSDKSRFEPSETDKKKLIEKFIAATKASDEKTLLSLFTEDAVMTSDGGGKVTSARRAIEGRRKIVNLFSMLGKKGRGLFNVEIKNLNGELGTVTTVLGQNYSAAVYKFEGEKIRAVYQVMNPDKLKKL